MGYCALGERNVVSNVFIVKESIIFLTRSISSSRATSQLGGQKGTAV